MLPTNSRDSGDSTDPVHVAIVMDGNGRWARQRGLERIEGHQAGAERLRQIVKYCSRRGIRYLTVFAFSTENWRRGKDEVDGLSQLFQNYIDSETAMLHEHDIRVRFIGSRRRLERSLINRMTSLEAETSEHRKMLLTVALNYGGRREIAHMARNVAHAVVRGEIALDEITEDLVGRHAYSPDLPDPDLIVRTSGECRLSNFLLWQAAYSELEFVSALWPDFTVSHFEGVLENYSRRSRRYGAL
ncbi:MAG: polyprenyl diphosphate synthase [Rhodobacteraceae bacterium]|nr:polyprenyl diphosphate synthase [Paracoccaceae bacterium]